MSLRDIHSSRSRKSADDFMCPASQKKVNVTVLDRIFDIIPSMKSGFVKKKTHKEITSIMLSSNFNMSHNKETTNRLQGIRTSGIRPATMLV
ncbi:hypothetical protein T4A_4905 [Trichinella pseudospiralis]|uniref:Uncharacterized protein n=1 Tax=Trichinella pseudospiralis TaxID=6337 RepID=A0A0V1EQ68_TRIPS|nr:hypothetical protein T4A_4905 [Trichinella pseudospiralis]